MSRKFRSLSNEDGIATIAMVVTVATAVLSYTAFTTTNYVLMMTESKRQRRQVMGFEMMRQIGETVQEARQRHHNETVLLGNADCSAEPNGATTTVGRFCFPANGFCVANPLDPNGNVANSEICFRGAFPGSTTPTARWEDGIVMLSQMPTNSTLMAKWQMRLEKFNNWYGQKALAVAEKILAEAPVAHAVREQDYMRDFSTLTPQTHTFQLALNEECTAAQNPTNICMTCAEAGGPANATRPACIRIAICPKGLMGTGNCDQADASEWYWQTIAVTNPVVVLP